MLPMLTNFGVHINSPLFNLPRDVHTNVLMLERWIHLIAGITWLGLLYFFNLVNTPFMREIDDSTRSKVIPLLLPRALWWFRMSAVVTVLAGIAYWSDIVASDARNASANSGIAMGSFFGIWTIVWALMYVLLIPRKGILNKGPVLAVLYAAILIAASWLFLTLNHHGWESNRMLSIGIGGGFGWVMMLNVWGVIWRIQKRIIVWTKEGKPMQEKARAMSRMVFLCSRTNFFMSIPLLFLMGAASHYPMFG
jgi:uncharacterized membrane protein